MPTDPQTHHPTCYREHHACAVARLDRLRERLDDAGADLWRPAAPKSLVLRMYIQKLLVAVRDITEGRT
jgi:hypothetical protein